MSVYGLMRTGVSGMGAQANRLGTVADNIANARTTGYKRASTEFVSLVLDNHGSDYTSGGVESKTRYAISQRGNLEFSSSATDLAVNGNGFFLVGDAQSRVALTRAGSFVPDSEGRLINAAGFRLLGYPLTGGAAGNVVNGIAGLEEVNVRGAGLVAVPTTSGVFTVNLNVDAAIVPAADLPSAGGAVYTSTSSLKGYDNVGREVVMDVYYTKTAANTWEVSIFDRATAAPGGGFPYSAAALSTQTLTFDPATGSLAPASQTNIVFTIPNGASVTLDLAATSELGAEYSVIDAELNGNGASAIDRVEFADDGLVYAVYENGARDAIYRIPLAKVASPDNLKPAAGNIFHTTADSGDMQIGFPNESALGSIISGALEGSNVDIASELTTMIESQRNYTANSKVFQTGSELLEVLVNLKR
jgi:flagellar hook protein FlgE